MITLIIFDAGGVLYIWNQRIVDETIKKFLAKHNVNDFDNSVKIWSKIGEVVSNGKITAKEGYETWLESIGLEKSLLNEWLALDEQEIWSKFNRMPQVNEVLAMLNEKYSLAVLSDTIDSKSERIRKMKLVGINCQVFDEIFTSHDLGVCKPDEKAFYAVLEQFCVTPNETLFVSDMLDELLGAKEIGLNTVGFNCEGGDYCVKNLTEIPLLLNKI